MLPTASSNCRISLAIMIGDCKHICLLPSPLAPLPRAGEGNGVRAVRPHAASYWISMDSGRPSFLTIRPEKKGIEASAAIEVAITQYTNVVRVPVTMK